VRTEKPRYATTEKCRGSPREPAGLSVLICVSARVASCAVRSVHRRPRPCALHGAPHRRHHCDLLPRRPVILHALPVRQPNACSHRLEGSSAGRDIRTWNLCRTRSAATFSGGNRFFEGVFCRAATSGSTFRGRRTKPAGAEIVSSSYFPVRSGPALGRVLGAMTIVRPAQTRWWCSLTTLEVPTPEGLRTWGRKVLVNQHPMTVVGVAARTSAAST